jgi:hypothetical protein
MLSNKTADIGVVFCLIGFIVWYGLDAWQVSQSVENLILIVPIGIGALLLCVIELLRQFLGYSKPIENAQPVKEVFPVIALFSAYVLSLEWLGFDVATTLFVGVYLVMQGERRWVWVVGYSVCFGLFMAMFFAKMLPYPMPMSLFPTDY